MSKARLVGLGFGILMIIAAFGVVLWQTSAMQTTGTAFAQGGSTATPSASGTTTPPQTPPVKTEQQQQTAIGDAFWAALATKLNVSVDTLKTSAVAARQAMIDQAVTDGRITQAQADAIKQQITADNIIAPINLGRGVGRPNGGQPGTRPGNGQGGTQHVPGQMPGGFGGPGPMMGPGFPGFGGRGGGFGGGFGTNLQELTAIATALKLEPQALVTQLSSGKTLADIATAQSVDQNVVKQAIIDFRTKQIDERLALGLISLVQANQLKAQLTLDSIDLTRGFHFNMETVPGQQQQSQVLPVVPANVQTQ